MGWGWSHAIALGVTATAALAVSEVYAGGCPPAATVYPAASYQATTTYYPVAATTYYAAPVKVIREKVYVPKVIKTYEAPEFYSSTQDHYRDKILVDAIAGKTAEALQLQQRLQQMEQSLQQSQQSLMQFQYQQLQQQQWQTPPPQQQPHYPPQQQAPYMPPAQNGYGYPPGQQPYGHGQQQTPSTVPQGLNQVLSHSCLACHGTENQRRGGGLDLRHPESVPYETRLQCLTECAVGNMPQGRQRLSDQDMALLYQWAQLGRQTARR